MKKVNSFSEYGCLNLLIIPLLGFKKVSEPQVLQMEIGLL